ncbi:putative transcriptional regulator, GntR family [Methanohalobium evestigatum Z-7303]|uniref:Putative transcriptional regulator, GntR family n=1 Tax=Methanohalobium evestigatum (strain ATCC BAA-1072 / DSM 3721 / NBRC 107634 / OCM 161 / Z-7303) TaxID=644295 RepID=D7E7W7_METEZ|nr:GntR family transcriptional regulator [Methanohalobium evestigatum]ADI73309.1 putative transcriptional regulator, GntR family [Methanohalobium evestigatum Z-7303]
MPTDTGTDIKDYKQIRNDIKKHLKESDITIGDLANRFGVSKVFVREIKRELRTQNQAYFQRNIPDKNNWFYCYKCKVYIPACNYKACEYYPCKK